MGLSPEMRAARKLARDSYVTGTHLALARQLIFLPENVTGLRIVDIGAGADSITAELRSCGADAFAIDYRYGNNPNALIRALNRDGMDTETLHRFAQDYNEHRERYLAAVVGGEKLPFKDNSVNAAFSLKCLSTIVLDDFATFLRAYEEIVRILIPHEDPKQAGILSINPWAGSLSMSPINHPNAMRFMKYLENDQKVAFFVARPNPYLSTLLITRHT